MGFTRRVGGLMGLALLASAIVANAQTMDKGGAVFAAQKCSLCHALDGKGNAKGPLDGIGSKLKADEIRQWILNPAEMAAKAKAERKPTMKAFATMPKDDLDALVAFLAAKKK
jgi:mono/diheme cytochrome c family protein